MQSKPVTFKQQTIIWTTVGLVYYTYIFSLRMDELIVLQEFNFSLVQLVYNDFSVWWIIMNPYTCLYILSLTKYAHCFIVIYFVVI